MSMCSCPAGTALPAVPNASCPQNWGQTQKIIFQRIFKSPGTKNSFTSSSNIKQLSSWTALFSENESSSNPGTKCVITPYVEAPTADGGDAITFGGGNDTVGGTTKVIGRNPVK